MKKFEDIMKNWATSTGLATVAVGADGKYISECYNVFRNASSSGCSGSTCPPITLPSTVPSSRVIGID